jgi:hypothetical protein
LPRLFLARQEPTGLLEGRVNHENTHRCHNPGSPGATLTAASRLEATATISRKAFGITALPVAVADNITITVTMSVRPEYIKLADARHQDNL